MADVTGSYEINFQEAERISNLLAEYPQIAGDEMQKAMLHAVRITRLAVQKYTPVYTTQLRRSIVGRVERNIVGQAADVTGIVGTDKEYALAVELGRGPGSLPPEEPLIRWATVVLGDGEAGKAVRWAIFHRGTKKPPKAMFARGWREVYPRVVARFKQALSAIVERLAGGR